MTQSQETDMYSLAVGNPLKKKKLKSVTVHAQEKNTKNERTVLLLVLVCIQMNQKECIRMRKLVISILF